jgi:hypothetical protein
MIQIIIPIFHNYDLVYKQIQHWNEIVGEYELLFCDNTPKEFSKTIPFDNIDLMAIRCDITSIQYTRLKNKIKWYTFTDFDGIDGIRHGSVIDYMVKQATSDFVCIQDSDFFWIDSQILQKVVNYINLGYDVIGAELYYDDFGYVNDVYPDRAGWKAPCIFGMFVKREYLLDKTFISTHYEAKVCKKETGWRVRKAMIDDGLRMIIFNAVKSPLQNNTPCFKSWFYVGVDYPGQIIGFHLIQASGEMSHLANQAYEQMMKLCKLINSNVIKIVNRIFL